RSRSAPGGYRRKRSRISSRSSGGWRLPSGSARPGVKRRRLLVKRTVSRSRAAIPQRPLRLSDFSHYGTIGTSSRTLYSGELCWAGPVGSAGRTPMTDGEARVRRAIEGLQYDFSRFTIPHFIAQDRKSTRLNSSHVKISYAV